MQHFWRYQFSRRYWPSRTSMFIRNTSSGTKQLSKLTSANSIWRWYALPTESDYRLGEASESNKQSTTTRKKTENIFIIDIKLVIFYWLLRLQMISKRNLHLIQKDHIGSTRYKKMALCKFYAENGKRSSLSADFAHTRHRATKRSPTQLRRKPFLSLRYIIFLSRK